MSWRCTNHPTLQCELLQCTQPTLGSACLPPFDSYFNPRRPDGRRASSSHPMPPLATHALRPVLGEGCRAHLVPGVPGACCVECVLRFCRAHLAPEYLPAHRPASSCRRILHPAHVRPAHTPGHLATHPPSAHPQPPNERFAPHPRSSRAAASRLLGRGRSTSRTARACQGAESVPAAPAQLRHRGDVPRREERGAVEQRAAGAREEDRLHGDVAGLGAGAHEEAGDVAHVLRVEHEVLHVRGDVLWPGHGAVAPAAQPRAIKAADSGIPLKPWHAAGQQRQDAPPSLHVGSARAGQKHSMQRMPESSGTCRFDPGCRDAQTCLTRTPIFATAGSSRPSAACMAQPPVDSHTAMYVVERDTHTAWHSTHSTSHIRAQ